MFDSFFESMSLARRLSLGFISVLTLLLAVAITSSYALKLQGERVQRIVQVNNIKTALANDLMDSINEVAIRSRSAALFTEMDHKQLQLEFNAAMVAKESFLRTERKLNAMLADESSLGPERTVMADIFAAKKKVFSETEESLGQALAADNVAAVLTLSNRVRPAEIQLRAHVTALIDLQAKISEQASRDVLALQEKVLIAVGVLVCLALGMGGTIAWRITTSVTTPITRMQMMMTEIASSQDFSRRVPVDRMDEIGLSLVAFNTMIEKIEESSLLLLQRSNDIQTMHNELNTSFEQLKIAKDELVRSEKLAALGSLVAGIAHELNTPIGNGLMAMSTVCDALGSLRSEMAAKGLQRKTFESFLATMETASDIANRSLNRSAELVRSFKQLSLDQATDNRRTFSVREQLNGILLMLQPTLKKMPYQVETVVAEDLTMDSFPGALAQILTNLVNNALIHGFEGRDHGRILIQIESGAPGFLTLRFADDGRGIPEKIMPRIFDPFFTTKMGQGGSGLGLHIVYNAVTVTLGGTIGVASEPACGTEFTLTLPLQAPISARQGGNTGADTPIT